MYLLPAEIWRGQTCEALQIAPEFIATAPARFLIPVFSGLAPCKNLFEQVPDIFLMAGQFFLKVFQFITQSSGKSLQVFLFLGNGVGGKVVNNTDSTL